MKRIWLQAGYFYDSNLNIMFGEKYGFTFVVKDHGQNQCTPRISSRGCGYCDNWQLGYVSVFSGIVMGVSVIKGYELFAHRLSTRGASVSGLIILFMTYLANQLDWAFSAATAYEVSVFETFPYVNDLLAEGIIDSSTYIINLMLIYLTTVFAAAMMIVNALKAQKTKFDIRKLF